MGDDEYLRAFSELTMSEPLPPTPAPAPAPPVKIDWQAWGRALVVILTVVGAMLAKAPAPPASAPLPTPEIVHPPAAPEMWILLDSEGVRTTDAAVEKIADALKPGRWTAQGIPKPGEKGVSLTITVDDGVVVVPPKPPTPPEPAPIPATGFRVLILEESGARSPTLQSLLRTPEVENYLNSKTAKGPDGKSPEWRVLDPDYDTDGMKLWSDIWKAAYARAKQDSAAAGGKLPWLLVSDGTNGESVPLPLAPADLMTLLRKYGG